MKLLIILAIGLAAYAAFGQGQTTAVRPDGLGGYNVYSGKKQTGHVRPNPVMGGYDIHYNKQPATIAPLRLAPLPALPQASSFHQTAPRVTPVIQVAPIAVPARPIVAGPRFDMPALPWVPAEPSMDERLAAAKARGEAKAKEVFARHELVEISESELIKTNKKATK